MVGVDILKLFLNNSLLAEIIMQPNILIVDDTVEYGQLVQASLLRSGLQADYVTNGQLALDYLNERMPDVMLLDIGMPGMNGWAVLDEIKVRYPQATFPVIVLTAFNDPANKLVGKFQQQVYRYCTKPTDLRTLANTVMEAAQGQVTIQ